MNALPCLHLSYPIRKFPWTGTIIIWGTPLPAMHYRNKSFERLRITLDPAIKQLSRQKQKRYFRENPVASERALCRKDKFLFGWVWLIDQIYVSDILPEVWALQGVHLVRLCHQEQHLPALVHNERVSKEILNQILLFFVFISDRRFKRRCG